MSAKKILRMSIITVGLFLYPASLAFASEILYPPSGSITENGEVHVVILTKKREVKLVEVVKVIDRRTSYTIATDKPVAEMKNYIHITLQLEQGISKLEIRITYIDDKVEKLALNLFYYTPGTTPVIPDGFSYNTFHSEKDLSKHCSGCHQIDPLPSDKRPDEPSQSTCYSCHYQLVSGKYVHGPNATFQCLTCHRPGTTGYTLPLHGDTLCFACHIEEEPNYRKKYVHGPVNTGNCLICHNVHSSDYQFFLKNEINLVCSKCHPAKSYSDHPVANHPISGRPDPNRPGRELACTSCHNPHSSEYSPFLFYRKTSANSICFECHKK